MWISLARSRSGIIGTAVGGGACAVLDGGDSLLDGVAAVRRWVAVEPLEEADGAVSDVMAVDCRILDRRCTRDLAVTDIFSDSAFPLDYFPLSKKIFRIRFCFPSRFLLSTPATHTSEDVFVVYIVGIFIKIDN